MNPTKLRYPGFRNSPEVFNAIMVGTVSEFIISMADSVMFLIAKIDQVIIGLKSVGIHHRFLSNLFPDNRQKLWCRTVSYNLVERF